MIFLSFWNEGYKEEDVLKKAVKTEHKQSCIHWILEAGLKGAKSLTISMDPRLGICYIKRMQVKIELCLKLFSNNLNPSHMAWMFYSWDLLRTFSFKAILWLAIAQLAGELNVHIGKK